MIIKFSLLTNEEAIETLTSAIEGIGDYDHSLPDCSGQGETVCRVQVGTYEVPAGLNKEAVVEALQDFRIAKTFWTDWHCGSHNRPRWGFKILLYVGTSWIVDNPNYLLIDGQEVSQRHAPSLEYRAESFSLAGHLQTAKKRIRIKNGESFRENSWEAKIYEAIARCASHRENIQRSVGVLSFQHPEGDLYSRAVTNMTVAVFEAALREAFPSHDRYINDQKTVVRLRALEPQTEAVA